MRSAVREQRSHVILSDHGSSFGLGMGTRGRRGGTLTLTEEELIFIPAGPGAVVEIPLDEINHLSAGPSLPGGVSGAVLRVVHHGNLIMAIGVENPQTWIDALESTTGGMRIPLRGDARKEEGANDARGFRIVIAALLLTILLASISVPVLLSWMQASRESAPRPPASAAP